MGGGGREGGREVVTMFFIPSFPTYVGTILHYRKSTATILHQLGERAGDMEDGQIHEFKKQIKVCRKSPLHSQFYFSVLFLLFLLFKI